MKPKVKTTAKQLIEFKEAFTQTQQKLGLTDWKVYFELAPLPDAWANIRMDSPSSVATAQLTSYVEKDEKTFFDPSEVGKHEAIHLLLGRLDHAAHNRYATEGDIEASQEAIVRRLEKLL